MHNDWAASKPAAVFNWSNSNVGQCRMTGQQANLQLFLIGVTAMCAMQDDWAASKPAFDGSNSNVGQCTMTGQQANLAPPCRKPAGQQGWRDMSCTWPN